MTLNRIKGQAIIKHITGPANSENISLITKNQYYSLVIDESTDCTTSKNLGIIVRIFNQKCYDRFLGLVTLEDSIAHGIFNAILKILKENEILLKNMIGFTSDNCSVMMGHINGVQAKLKKEIPKLFVNGCVCHNLNLVATATLPENIDKLIREINYHFCNSSSRKAQFLQFQEEFGTELHIILKYAATRWLSRQVNSNTEKM